MLALIDCSHLSDHPADSSSFPPVPSFTLQRPSYHTLPPLDRVRAGSIQPSLLRRPSYPSSIPTHPSGLRHPARKSPTLSPTFDLSQYSMNQERISPRSPGLHLLHSDRHHLHLLHWSLDENATVKTTYPLLVAPIHAHHPQSKPLSPLRAS